MAKRNYLQPTHGLALESTQDGHIHRRVSINWEEADRGYMILFETIVEPNIEPIETRIFLTPMAMHMLATAVNEALLNAEHWRLPV